MPFLKHAGQGTGVHFKQVPNSPPGEEFIIEWANGAQVAFGNGTTDSDITYVKLTNADGEVTYIHGNADQNAIVVTGSRP